MSKVIEESQGSWTINGQLLEAVLPSNFSFVGERASIPCNQEVSCVMTMENWGYIAQGISEMVRELVGSVERGDLFTSDEGIFTCCLDLASEINRIFQSYLLNIREGGEVA